jgi:hypothetical protein
MTRFNGSARIAAVIATNSTDHPGRYATKAERHRRS